jgi:ABC-type lipoprotein release transport system permease subunit
MGLGKLWIIAYRDLGRNRRRSIFTLLAVALGLALLMNLHGLIAGVIDGTLQNSIRLQTGHVQVRASSFDNQKLSLQWKDLLDTPAALVARAAAMPGVKAAAAVLWAGGVLSTGNDSAGVQLYGVDTTSTICAPIRQGMVAGQFLTADDREGILIGKHLADSLGLAVGRTVNVAVVDANGQPSQTTFTIRGLFATGTPSYDDSAIILPLAKAQAFTSTQGRASAVVILLNRQDDAAKVAAAMDGPGLTALTYLDLNQVLLTTMQLGLVFYKILDFIVILVVAVIIANTLLMAVFERIREMGILAALGMKGRQIMLMFLLEAATLGLAGIVVGFALGSAGVEYLAHTGIYMGDMATAASGIALGTSLYSQYDLATFAWLCLATLIVILLAALYPAWFAARREPAEALRAL